MSVPKILYVDDDVLNRRLVQKMVKSFGYAYVDAPDAKEGIRLASLQQPDLIIMDYMLPDMDGLEATLSLKSLPYTTNIPVIMLTGDVMITPEIAKSVGCIAYLNKPVSMNTLLRTIVQVLETNPVN
jgi:CheY-like chemotaxis protein